MAGIRQSRAQRKAEPPPIRIQERDRFILEALGKMRFLTTAQIAALAFGHSRWAANKRLRKLLDAAFVRAWVRELAKENVYSLDRLGARTLDGDGRVPRRLDGTIEHLLGINQVRSALALALPTVPRQHKLDRME
jgi:hypothetical protein